MNKTVYIMRGLPGSGKNWYIDNGPLLKHLPNKVVCSADDYFVDKTTGEYKWSAQDIGAAHGWCQANFNAAIRLGAMTIVVNNTNTTPKEMKPYVTAAKDAGYKVVVIRMVVSPWVSFNRNVHSVPERSIQAMHNRFQDLPSEWNITESIIQNG